MYSLLIEIKSDIKANRGNLKALIILFFFRISHLIRISNLVIRILFFWVRLFYKVVIQWGFSIDIPDNLHMGSSVKIFHGMGLVINSNVILKNNITLRHNVTIGNKVEGGKSPIIGNNVDIGSNSVIIGDIEIGENVTIGAGSVVTKDVLPNSIVAGNPAIVIRFKE